MVEIHKLIFPFKAWALVTCFAFLICCGFVVCDDVRNAAEEANLTEEPSE